MVEYRKMINYPGYVDMYVSMPALVDLIAAESIGSKLFFKKIDESFYYVKYGSLNITPIVPSKFLF